MRLLFEVDWPSEWVLLEMFLRTCRLRELVAKAGQASEHVQRQGLDCDSYSDWGQWRVFR